MADQAEETKAADGEERRLAKKWQSMITGADSRERDWHKSGQEVISRYLDDRDRYTAEKDDSRRVNILWSTTEVQKGMLFSRLGKPDVMRQFTKGGKDNKIARTSAQVIERTLIACGNRYDPEFEITEAVEDQLLPGRGTCWLVYEPTFETTTSTETTIDEETGEETETETSEDRVTYQEARFEHVDWKDFKHGAAKKWRDVPWVARPMLLTEPDLEAQFPAHAKSIPLNYVPEEARHLKSEDQEDYKCARVWEFWYKPLKLRIYFADDYAYELDRQEDPYRLQDFFPCPRPLYGVKTASSLLPRPEFLQWQDQAAELDRVNTRIWRLLERLKYCGVYEARDGESNAVMDQLGSLRDGQFLPMKNLASLASGQGLERAFQVRDLGPIATAIQGLAQRAEQLMAQIWQVCGISDLMRGSSDPTETATAQNHKTRYGSQRQQQKQREVQRFVRDLYRMKGELVSEHFEREVLEEMSGIRLPLQAEKDQAKQALDALQKAQQQVQQFQQAMQQAQKAAQSPQQPQGGPNGMPAPMGAPQLPPPPADAMAILQAARQDPDQIAEWQEIAKAVSWEDISAVLRSDDRRNYKIDIETDMTALDETADEKGQRLELLGVIGQTLPNMIAQSTGNQPMAAMNRELLMSTLRPFKAARTLEESIEDLFSGVAQQQPQPSPEQALAQKESKLADLEIQNQTLELEGKRTANERLMLENKKIEQEGMKAVATIEAEAAESKRKQDHVEAMDREKMELEVRKVEIMEWEAYAKIANEANAPQAQGETPAAPVNGEAPPRPTSRPIQMGMPRLLGELTERLEQQQNQTQQIMAALTAPRRIIRGPDGEIAQVAIGN